VRRSKAADLIDRIREIAADTERSPELAIRNLRMLLESAGMSPLTACGGEAHSNAFIDNCMRCAPRWGFVGKKEPVT
jgi:hypothetical protein